MHKKCRNCGESFSPYKRPTSKLMNKQIFCSEKCSEKHQIEKHKLRRVENFKKEIGEKSYNLLLELARKQQFVEDSKIMDEKCLSCGKTENLIEHHISYAPVIKVVLCRKCHGFLHLNILKRKKCKP